MTNQEFREKMRENRGRLASVKISDNMDYINTMGTNDFVNYMLTTKKLGVDKAAQIISDLTDDEQDELVLWLDSKSASIGVSEIDLKVIRIQGDR